MAESTVIEELREIVQDWSGLTLHPEVFATLVEGEALIAEAERWGASDTVVREEAMDLTMKKLIGQGWPLNRDGLSEAELGALVEATQEAHDRLIPGNA